MMINILQGCSRYQCFNFFHSTHLYSASSLCIMSLETLKINVTLVVITFLCLAEQLGGELNWHLTGLFVK